jgi:hypothetical protein
MKKAYVITHPIYGLHIGPAGAGSHYFSSALRSLENVLGIPTHDSFDTARRYAVLNFHPDFSQACEVVEVPYEGSLVMEDMVGTRAERFVAPLILMKAKESGITFH